MMRRVMELMMYLTFSAAALPVAWLGLHNVLYFRAHPEMLEVRDAALEALALVAVWPFVVIALVAGSVLALYFLATGPRAARVSLIVLGVAYVGTLALIPGTPFRSFARIYWDGVTGVALCGLPLVCGAVRAVTGRSSPAVQGERAS